MSLVVRPCFLLRCHGRPLKKSEIQSHERVPSVNRGTTVWIVIQVSLARIGKRPRTFPHPTQPHRRAAPSLTASAKESWIAPSPNWNDPEGRTSSPLLHPM